MEKPANTAGRADETSAPSPFGGSPPRSHEPDGSELPHSWR